jgi:hypothetical protein
MARPDWTESEHCGSRVHCGVCRDLEGGRGFRRSVAAGWSVPGGTEDWDCPWGIAWGQDERGWDAVPCPYEYPATAAICRKCKSDSTFRMHVFGTWLQRKAQGRLSENCRHRSAEAVGEREERCCGGEAKVVPVYGCVKRVAPVHVGDCSRCRENTVWSLPAGEIQRLFPASPECQREPADEPRRGLNRAQDLFTE